MNQKIHALILIVRTAKKKLKTAALSCLLESFL